MFISRAPTLPPSPRGRLVCTVETESRQLVGRMTVRIVAAGPGDPAGTGNDAGPGTPGLDAGQIRSDANTLTPNVSSDARSDQPRRPPNRWMQPPTLATNDGQ